MLLEYPCAMQRKNYYWRPERNSYHKYAFTVAIVFFIFTDIVSAAPTYDSTLPESQANKMVEYLSGTPQEISGCYYNFQRYEEGDRITTNEPCLNCTCHNNMLMCYLRVCPFTKAIGQDCTIEKKPDQCCPIITCPEVPVKLLTSSTTSPAPITPTTELGFRDNYGCTINNAFYADGAQVPSDVNKPCELCYCIRNRTACVMQECTLHVEGCKPVFKPGVCCPVRYECDYDKESTSTVRLESTGGLIKSTTSSPATDCYYENQVFSDGELIKTEKPCEHCYCMRGDIVCAVQDCGEPLRGKDCVPTTPPPNKCCPSSYDCANDTATIEDITKASDLSGTTLFQSDNTYSSFETTPRYKNTPVVLSQEEIYDKLGEKKTPELTTPEKTTESLNLSSKHPSEDIQIYTNSVNAEEHNEIPSTTELSSKESPLTTYTYEKSSTEKAPTDESNDVETTTKSSQNNEDISLSPVSKASPDDVAQPLETTTVLLTNEISSESSSTEGITKPSSNAIPDDNAYSATEITTEKIKYETAKYTEGVKISDEKIQTTSISDEGHDVTTEKLIPTESVTGDKVADETTTSPSFSNTKIPLVSDKQPKPTVEEEYENSSESNKFQSTTRQFDKSTVLNKEQETTKAPEDDIQITTKSQTDNTEPPVESDKEQPTETINTLSHESTASLLENITKIVSSIAHEFHPIYPIDIASSTSTTESSPPMQTADVEGTKISTESSTTEKIEVYPGVTEKGVETTIKDDVGTVAPSVIPGEGSCLVDGITYPNTSVIESFNPCHSKCICLSSIPTCTLVTCAPPPNHPNCMPIQMKPESCCPVYICDNDQEATSMKAPSIHNLMKPNQPNLSNHFINEDLTTIVNGHEFSTLTPDYNKPSETITEKSKPENDLVDTSNVEKTTLPSQKIEPQTTEAPKEEVTVSESGIKSSPVVTETTTPELIVTTQHVISEKIDHFTTLNELIGGPTTIREIGSEESVTENVDKPESDDLHKIATTVKESYYEPSSSTETLTTLVAVGGDGEIHNHDDHTPGNEVQDENPIDDNSNSAVHQDGVSEYSPATKQTTEKYNDVTHSEVEPQYQDKETETSDKVITTESSIQDNSDLHASSTESNEGAQKHSTEIASSSEPASTVYNDKEVDINPTTLPPKSDEPNDSGNVYNIPSSTTSNVADNSEGYGEYITTTELPASSSSSVADSQTTVETYSSTPSAEIATEPQFESNQTTKTNEVYSSTEIQSTSEHIKQEPEPDYTTTLTADLGNEVSPSETTTAANTMNEVNSYSSERAPAVDSTYSISNEQTSELYSSSSPTTEKETGLDITEKYVPDQPSGPYGLPTTTVESATVIINEDHNSIGETTESPTSNDTYQPSSSPEYGVDTTEHEVSDSDKHTGSGIVVTNEPPNAVTIIPTNDEGNEINQEPVKPITILPATNDSPSVTVLPLQTTYSTNPPHIDHEDTQTEIVSNEPSGVSSQSPVSEVTQTKIPETNEILQQPADPANKVDTPITEHVEPSVTEIASPEPPKYDANPSTEKQASSILNATTYHPSSNSYFETSSVTYPAVNATTYHPVSNSYFETSSVTHPAIPQSTWTRKPYDEEVSEPNYNPSMMYPTGGGDTGSEVGEETYPTDDGEPISGPGTCRYGGKVYVSAQQIPRDDPCDFCFCFRSDIICLQQSCPPPIQGCRQEPIQGFCCPRYECPVATALVYNATTTTTTTTTSTTTTLPPHFPIESYRGHARRVGCMIHGYFYKVGEDIAIASGPCLECICGSDGRMKCDPKSCSPEPFVRSFMGEAISKR